MSAMKQAPPKPKLALSTRTLTRVIVAVVIMLVLVAGGFGGYYYWDRYLHAGDKSPLELDIDHLQQAIRDDPQNPDTRLALAQFYLAKGMMADAYEQATQVLTAFPDNDGAMLVAGIAGARMQKYEIAVDPLEKFVAAHKDSPMANADTALETAYYFLGESYLQLNQAENAIASFKGALAITPTDADALYQLGKAYQTVGKPEQALEQYQKAVRLVPDFTEAYTGMIESYTSLNQPEYVAYARGMQAFSMKDFNTAQIHLERAAETLTDFAPAYLGLGLTYEKLGLYDKALTALSRGIELNPNDFAIQQSYARVQATLNGQNIQ